MSSRSVRALRSIIGGAVATFVAAAFHVVGGGENPGAVTLLLALAAATLAGLALSTTRFSTWRLALSVVVAQAAFHLIFQVTGASSSLAVHGHAAAAVPTGSSMAHGAAPMTAAHLVAAVITIAALARGEQALLDLWRLMARFALRLLRRAADPIIAVAPGIRRPVRRRPVLIALRSAAAEPLSRRGPPLPV